MSNSGWEALRSLIVWAVETVDWMKWWILGLSVVAVLVWLGIFALKVFLNLSGRDATLTLTESNRLSLPDRLDQMACVAISRRPRRRKRRHRHRST